MTGCCVKCERSSVTIGVLSLPSERFQSWGGRGRALCRAPTYVSYAAAHLRTVRGPKKEGMILATSWGALRLQGSFPQLRRWKFYLEQITAVLFATFCFPPHGSLSHFTQCLVKGKLLLQRFPDPSLMGLITKGRGKRLPCGVLICDAESLSLYLLCFSWIALIRQTFTG